ncbi:hypothetical protein AB0M50_54545, partial [Nonomuraea fuscirosea]
MRKTLTGLGLAFFLTLAPAAVATADSPVAPVAQSQVTPAPQDDRRDEGGGNAGLWWACAGGGGGNFGVVTRFWFRTPGRTG